VAGPLERSIQNAKRVVELLTAHGGGLYALLWRITRREDVAEDLMQDLAIKLGRAPGFAAADHPLAYARRAATNLAMDWLRHTVRRRGVWGGQQAGAERVSTAVGPLEGVLAAERRDLLLWALAAAPPMDQAVVTLRFLEGLAYEEVGAAVGKTAAQARGLCFKALGRLRQQINAEEVADAKR